MTHVKRWTRATRRTPPKSTLTEYTKNLFVTQIFFQLIFFSDSKFFYTQNFCVNQNSFWIQNFFKTQNSTKYFSWTQNFFGTQIFWTSNIFQAQSFFRPNIFADPNFFWPKMNFNENDLWRDKTELLNLRLSKRPSAKVLLKLEFDNKDQVLLSNMVPYGPV